MFNNSTEFFINTLASLQRIDELEQLVNPNSAFFQSYRNSLNEVNLNCIEPKPLNDLPKAEIEGERAEQQLGEPQGYRNIPSLEYLPSNFLTKVPANETATIEYHQMKESYEAIGSQLNAIKPLRDRQREQKNSKIKINRNSEPETKFSFEKTDTVHISKADKPINNSVQAIKCTCTNSRCLKLYCGCFSAGVACGPHCNCRSCYNNEQNEDVRKAMVEETLQKNPNAFQSKYRKHAKKNALVHVRGCNCNKTRCVKEYCECYKMGTGCSRLCRCVNCLNKKLELQTEELQDYFVKTIRKRSKTKFFSTQFGKKHPENDGNKS